MSKITVRKLVDKNTGKEFDISDLVIKNQDDSISTVNSQEVTIDNAKKLNNKTEQELLSNIDAATLNGFTAAQLNGIDPATRIRLLTDTSPGNATSSHNMVAVAYDETIYYWGKGHDNYQPTGKNTTMTGLQQVYNPLKGKSKVKKILNNYTAFYFLYENGDLYVAGRNNTGQLGLGHTNSVHQLTKTNSNVKELYVGSSSPYVDVTNAFVLKNDGSLQCCGTNAHGCLGIGNTTQQNSWVSVVLPGLDPSDTIKDIKPGGGSDANTYVLTEQGNVYVTGYNSYGQLGTGSTTVVNKFQKITIPNGEKAELIRRSVGVQSSSTNYAQQIFYVLTKQGNVYSCGYNQSGELGQGNKTNQNTLKPIAQIPSPYNSVTNPIVDIIVTTTAPVGVFLLSKRGDLFAIGRGIYGGLGLGPSKLDNVDTPTFTHNNVKSVFPTASCLHAHTTTFIITTDGKLKSCGRSDQGQVGQGKNDTVISQWGDVLFSENPEDIIQFSCTGDSNCISVFILLKDGRLFGVGYNGHYQVRINSHITDHANVFHRLFIQ